MSETPLKDFPDISAMKSLNLLKTPIFYPPAPLFTALTEIYIRPVPDKNITISPIKVTHPANLSAIALIDMKSIKLRSLANFSAFLPKTHPVTLDITGNQFYCDEWLVCWLRNLADTHSHVNVTIDNYPCLTPSEWATQTWSDIKLINMKCPSKLLLHLLLF